MSILSSLSSLLPKKLTQQAGYVNGQPIASFYTPQASTMQPKPLASTMPLASPKPITPQVTSKPIVSSAPKPLSPLPTVTPQASPLSSADLLNNTQNAYRDSGLIPQTPAYNSAPVAPTPTVQPQEDYLKSFRDEILKYLTPTEQENQLQSDYNNVLSSRDLGVAEYRNRPVPMQIITGQTQALNEQAGIKASTLKDKLALEQARRQAGLEVSKFGYEAAKDQAALNKPQEVGGDLVQLNPATGKYEAVYSKPQENKPVEVNGQLVQYDPTTGQYKSVFGSPKQDLPASAQEYEYAVKQGYKGTYQQYQTEDANRKRSVTNINTGGLSNQQNTRVNQITGQFDNEPIVKNYNIIAEGKAFVDSIPNNTQNPADQQGLIYAFAKAMDPNSVVREGEYATVQKYAQSWAQSFGFNAQRIFSNSPFLSAQAIANMKATINSKYAAAKTNYDNVYNEYGRRIEQQAGVSGGTNYLTNYAGAYSGTSNQSPVALLEDDIKQVGSQYPTREKLIEDLVKSYPELTRAQIASKVYTLIPDKK